MSASTLLLSLFRHKAWANGELFAELAKVDPAKYSTERHTAIRLLNHLYVVDQIFAAHLRGEAHGHSATNTSDTPTLEALRDAVAACDLWYVEHSGVLTPQALAEPIDFVFTDGQPGRMSREEMLAHVATHGSYHRGAVGRIMATLAVPTPRDLFTVHLHQSEPQRRVRA